MKQVQTDEIDEHDHRSKVAEIFRELAGERSGQLAGNFFNKETCDAITNALIKDGKGETEARAVAFHLSDWNADAAFIVAMHLFPERFTPEEITDGVMMFLTHAPEHIVAAAKFSGFEIDGIFEAGDDLM